MPQTRDSRCRQFAIYTRLRGWLGQRGGPGILLSRSTTAGMIDRTQTQSTEDQQRALQRSLERMQPPAQPPGYEIERFLGAGAYGEVWVGTDRNTGRRVAIKFYTHRGGLDWSLLSREVEKLAFLSADRYVVQLIDVAWQANPPYYVMEYLERGSLEDRLKDGPLSVPQAAQLFREVAVGLVHSHNRGVLHCDLKPANILLDQDQRPRLADFGQSRLSHEQTPALGTLFYMAPEQADLEAVPDARWDVYALGALMHSMVTGQPPFRSEELVRDIELAGSLEERLTIYRRGIQNAPRPMAHRQTPGMDRALADIIDRCLAVHPSRRFPNVQSVLSALDERQRQRARRPLLVFGVLGPALLLAVMAVYAWNVFRTVMQESDRRMTERALESSHFAARFVAEAVARQIDRRWLLLEQAAANNEVRRMIESNNSKRLQDWIEQLKKRNEDVGAASWFISDDEGNRLARHPFSEGTADRNFNFRDYFHGLGKDFPEGTTGQLPIRDAYRSLVFTGKTDKRPIVGFSVPVWSDGDEETRKILGVLTMTVELGGFAELESNRASGNNQIAVLIDTRPDEDERQGRVLEHKGLPLEAVYVSQADLVLMEQLRLQASQKVDQNGESAGPTTALLEDYRDPIGGESYGGRWLAACEPVFVQGRSRAARDTGWMVVVQEKYDAATAPVKMLGNRLVQQGLLALGVVVGVITLLWGFVVVVLTDSPRAQWIHSLRRSVGMPTPRTAGTGSGTAGSRKDTA